MGKGHSEPLLAFVRELGPGSAASSSDGQLLERFCRERDQAAFTALVQRHGPMVLSVCRRVLGNRDEAEDAFQAAFLVLARRAAAISHPEFLGNWLFGVAWRTASRARAAMARRQMHEKRVATAAEPSAEKEVERREMARVLDEELQRLPGRYRAAFVVCYLEGKTQAEAAAQLGWPPGVLRGRLERSREKLRKRLLQRGFGLTAGALSAAFADDVASAAVSTAFAERTACAAVAFAAGMRLAGTLPSGTVTLARGVLDAMFVAKLKLTVGVLLALCALGSGLIWGRAALAQRSTAGDKHVALPPAPAVQLASVVTKQNKLAQPNDDPTAAKLEELVTIGFDQRTRFEDAVKLISDKYNLTIVIDSRAFEQVGGRKPGEDVETCFVHLHKVVDVKLYQVLDMLLDQAGGDYVVQDNIVRVVPREWVKTGMAIRQLVDLDFKHASLTYILETLARRSGASIALDQRVSKIAEDPMSIHLQRVPLVSAVAVLADMNGLRAVPVHSMIYSTSKENAEMFEAKQAPMLRQIEPYFAPPPGPRSSGENPQARKK